MFGLFEKWINEHGSAVILRERVAQLESELSILRAKLAALTAENEALKLQLQHQKVEIDQLRDLANKRRWGSSLA